MWDITHHTRVMCDSLIFWVLGVGLEAPQPVTSHTGRKMCFNLVPAAASRGHQRKSLPCHALTWCSHCMVFISTAQSCHHRLSFKGLHAVLQGLRVSRGPLRPLSHGLCVCKVCVWRGSRACLMAGCTGAL